jgi:antitoxin (DNA-binding transcriptional repressor) of toxin-antitoxin stability system
MKQVSIRDLHQKTGYWVRLASRQPIVVTDRGRPVATLVPSGRTAGPGTLPDREVEIKKLPRTPDSAPVISEDRDRA